MRHLLIEKKMTTEKAEQILNSWLGHAKNGCSHNFVKGLIERNDYIYMNNKNVLKVDTNKLQKEGDLNAA